MTSSILSREIKPQNRLSKSGLRFIQGGLYSVLFAVLFFFTIRFAIIDVYSADLSTRIGAATLGWGVYFVFGLGGGLSLVAGAILLVIGKFTGPKQNSDVPKTPDSFKNLP